MRFLDKVDDFNKLSNKHTNLTLKQFLLTFHLSSKVQRKTMDIIIRYIYLHSIDFTE